MPLAMHQPCTAAMVGLLIGAVGSGLAAGRPVESDDPSLPDAPDDEGHQPWREACVEDPTAYASCQP